MQTITGEQQAGADQLFVVLHHRSDRRGVRKRAALGLRARVHQHHESHGRVLSWPVDALVLSVRRSAAREIDMASTVFPWRTQVRGLPAKVHPNKTDRYAGN